MPRFDDPIVKVVKGKKYSTATAKLGMWVPPASVGGGHEWELTGLFRTAKGQWFLAGEGGAATQWRREQTSGWAFGQGLRLLSEDEARQIMEEHDGPVESFFEVEEG